MKTAEEIVEYMEAELAKALELHNQAKGKDAQEALFQIIKVTVFEEILQEIK